MREPSAAAVAATVLHPTAAEKADGCGLPRAPGATHDRLGREYADPKPAGT